MTGLIIGFASPLLLAMVICFVLAMRVEEENRRYDG